MWSNLVSNPRRGRQVIGLFILSFGVAALGLPAMGQMGSRVSIIDLQFMRTSANAVEKVALLGPSGVDAAQMAHYLDLLYLVFYALALSAACVVLAARAADQGQARLAALGPRVAWMAVIAAGLDAVEDVAILLVLDGRTEQPWPAIAFGCSVVKFALLAVVIVYLVVGLVATLRRETPAEFPADS
ncbi:MAG: hypothetical protein ACRDOT_08965 [Aeromicrobium sp.]